MKIRKKASFMKDVKGIMIDTELAQLHTLHSITIVEFAVKTITYLMQLKYLN